MGATDGFEGEFVCVWTEYRVVHSVRMNMLSIMAMSKQRSLGSRMWR